MIFCSGHPGEGPSPGRRGRATIECSWRVVGPRQGCRAVDLDAAAQPHGGATLRRAEVRPSSGVVVVERGWQTAASLGRTLQGRCLVLRHLVLAALADQLVDGGHLSASLSCLLSRPRPRLAGHGGVCLLLVPLELLAEAMAHRRGRARPAVRGAVSGHRHQGSSLPRASGGGSQKAQSQGAAGADSRLMGRPGSGRRSRPPQARPRPRPTPTSTRAPPDEEGPAGAPGAARSGR